MQGLKLNAIVKSFSDGNPVLQGISLNVPVGAIMALVGPSGGGKSTLLRCIAGFEKPDSGEVIMSEREMSSSAHFTAPEKRPIGFFFQDYALFPHMTVKANIEFGLHGMKKSERNTLVKDLLHRLELDDLDRRYPHELSGGQQQRVALARAVAPKPELLLLDEPFSNIDTQFKKEVRILVKQLIREEGITAIIVTHDLEDAIDIADRFVFLEKGSLVQEGTLDEIRQDPATPFISSYFQ